MDKTEKTIEALRVLIATDQDRSDTARLRDIYEGVEAARKAGVSREKIWQTLQEQGFKLTLRGFDTALHRIRRERKAAAGIALKAPQSTSERAPRPPTPTPAAPETQVGESPAEVQVDPDRNTELADDGLPLTPKQRRERRAAQYIKSGPGNSLVSKLIKGNKE